jgi:hypothetical protein
MVTFPLDAGEALFIYAEILTVSWIAALPGAVFVY